MENLTQISPDKALGHGLPETTVLFKKLCEERRFFVAEAQKFRLRLEKMPDYNPLRFWCISRGVKTAIQTAIELLNAFKVAATLTEQEESERIG